MTREQLQIRSRQWLELASRIRQRQRRGLDLNHKPELYERKAAELARAARRLS